MEITVTVKLTEGMVYDAMKEAVQEFFTNLPSQENKTGLLKHSLWSQILRNGKPVTDSDIGPLFQSPIKGVAKNVWHDRQKKSVTAQQPPPISRLIGSNADTK